MVWTAHEPRCLMGLLQGAVSTCYVSWIIWPADDRIRRDPACVARTIRHIRLLPGQTESSFDSPPITPSLVAAFHCDTSRVRTSSIVTPTRYHYTILALSSKRTCSQDICSRSAVRDSDSLLRVFRALFTCYLGLLTYLLTTIKHHPTMMTELQLSLP